MRYFAVGDADAEHLVALGPEKAVVVGEGAEAVAVESDGDRAVGRDAEGDGFAVVDVVAVLKPAILG